MRNLINETVKMEGKNIMVAGWVNSRRDMGRIVFIDLRDKTGLIQLVFAPSELNEKSYQLAKNLRLEFVIRVKGIVNKRSPKTINPNLETGKIEILVKDLEILNEARTLPFEIDKDTRAISEELRLKYRYLDLRSERMHKNMILRDRIVSSFRGFLHKNDFVEIETPYITRGTPEGAREFIIPSRRHKGKFYALPQSPQQFKQLLMVAGLERYFQVARCFRDEDQRGDRQLEFTQLDMEMSFVEREDVLQIVEKMMIEMVKTAAPEKKIQQIPFPRLSYKEVMKKYKTDKPDLRKDKNNPNLLAFAWVVDFPFFEKTDDGGWTFSHNPFSRPIPEHTEWLLNKKKIGEILTTQYDLVLNGYEVGGGSIRNHESKPLKKVFEIMGFSEKQIDGQFGHMIEAFSYGAPPHGGIAPGIDRMVMVLANEPNIREVIAFPKTGEAEDLMMGAPSKLTDKQLKEAHIKLIK